MNEPAGPTPTPGPSPSATLGSGPRSAFVVVLTYTAPLARIDELLEAHRAWLAEQEDAGRLLASGPLLPRTGGVLLAAGGSRAEVETALASDPFHLAGVATYEVVEFTPTRGPLAGSLAQSAAESAAESAAGGGTTQNTLPSGSA